MHKFIIPVLVIFLVSIGCAAAKPNIPDFNKAATAKDAYFPPEGQKEYTLDDFEIVVIADPPKYTLRGEKQKWTSEKELALFDGILLNPEGVARILSEYAALHERGGAALDKQRQTDLAKLQLETGKLQLKLSTTYKKSNIIIKGKDEEIKRQQKINKDILDDKSNVWDDILIGGGSGAAGILVGLLIAALAF